MVQKIKQSLLSVSALLAILLSGSALVVPAVVSAAAANPDPQAALCGGAQDLQLPAGSGTGTACPKDQAATDSFNHILTVVINIFSVVVGVVAVLMIIVGGFRYITSGGKQESVTGAKSTILYAVIGLVIVALAQIIVKFVLDKATSTTG